MVGVTLLPHAVPMTCMPSGNCIGIGFVNEKILLIIGDLCSWYVLLGLFLQLLVILIHCQLAIYADVELIGHKAVSN